MATPRRAITTVVFDLDGTLVRYRGVEFESSWGAIAAAAGVGDRSEALLREYFPRREAYSEWVAADAALLAGIPYARVAGRVLPAPYADGVKAAVRALRPRYGLGILSSGVDIVADWVCRDLGLDFAVANRVHVRDGVFTGTSETVVDLWAKDAALRVLAAERGIDLDEICFVGDHVNDIPVMRIVGMAVAANPKDDALADVADYVIERFEVLPRLVDAWPRG
ncbi:MAG: HAD family phosphatase [Candidatus Bipolaricaulota bacterium]|nr:HAD family phosphatase [Candidatus Bipolaricaulota bacterium]